MESHLTVLQVISFQTWNRGDYNVPDTITTSNETPLLCIHAWWICSRFDDRIHWHLIDKHWVIEAVRGWFSVVDMIESVRKKGMNNLDNMILLTH